MYFYTGDILSIQIKTEYKVRYIARISIIVSVFSLLCLSLMFIAYHNMVSEEFGEQAFYEINDRASIREDANGILVISSDNTHDLLFAQGYTAAKFRLLQMMSMRQTFQGRMSEIAGSKAILLDKYMRTLGLKNAADESYKHLSLKTKKNLQAYTDGVNAYMANHDLSTEFKLLGFKPEQWRPEDTVLIQKVMAWNMSRNWTHKYSNSMIRKNFGIKSTTNFTQLKMHQTQPFLIES